MLGIIGGTGVYEILDLADLIKKEVIKTSYGNSTPISHLKIKDQSLLFLPRHEEGHKTPAHRINYLANIQALYQLGVDRIIATNSVGTLYESLEPGKFLVPDDFLDFTRVRPFTFYDDQTVHVDVTQPYCPQLRQILIKSGEIVDGGVYVCTEGPRFETPAEIEMFRRIGGTVVGMTGFPEMVLAREREMCYASLCMVTNYAASITPDKLTVDEVLDIVKEKEKDLVRILQKTILKLPTQKECTCSTALQGAKI